MERTKPVPLTRPDDLNDASSRGRRAARRVGLKGAASVLLPGNVERDVQMADLGEDGLSVMAAKPISPGSRCTVSFDLPFTSQPSTRVSVAAKAVYSSYTGADGFKVGMQFTALDAATVQLLADFLR
jgi:hypothetical protein